MGKHHQCKCKKNCRRGPPGLPGESPLIGVEGPRGPQGPQGEPGDPNESISYIAGSRWVSPSSQLIVGDAYTPIVATSGSYSIPSTSTNFTVSFSGIYDVSVTVQAGIPVNSSLYVTILVNGVSRISSRIPTSLGDPSIYKSSGSLLTALLLTAGDVVSANLLTSSPQGGVISIEADVHSIFRTIFGIKYIYSGTL